MSSVSSAICFVIDGDLLSQKYKIEPYSFFGTTTGKSKGALERGYDESEEYVDSAIDNFKSYVKDILIYREHLKYDDPKQKDFFISIFLNTEMFDERQKAYLSNIGYTSEFRMRVLKRYFEHKGFTVQVKNESI